MLTDLPDVKGTEPFCPQQALNLEPLKTSLIITGPVDISAALIKGILLKVGTLNLSVEIRDSKNLAAAFAGDGETDEMNKLIAKDLLIIPISYGTPSERVGQVTFFTWDERQKKGRPTWFIVYAIDSVLRGSYTGPLMDLLSGKEILGQRLKELNSLDMRKFALGTSVEYSLAGKVQEVPRDDSVAPSATTRAPIRVLCPDQKPQQMDFQDDTRKRRFRPNYKSRPR
jgi:hypothetical protein